MFLTGPRQGLCSRFQILAPYRFTCRRCSTAYALSVLRSSFFFSGVGSRLKAGLRVKGLPYCKPQARNAHWRSTTKAVAWRAISTRLCRTSRWGLEVQGLEPFGLKVLSLGNLGLPIMNRA